jgi:hypothetical protein
MDDQNQVLRVAQDDKTRHFVQYGKAGSFELVQLPTTHFVNIICRFTSHKIVCDS